MPLLSSRKREIKRKGKKGEPNVHILLTHVKAKLILTAVPQLCTLQSVGFLTSSVCPAKKSQSKYANIHCSVF